ncbi:MAG: IS5/IS1182 family transposase, partial [Alphaproteobacteria bacterium]
MNDLFWLTKSQFNRIKPYFPLPHGIPRVDDLRVISGIIHVLKRG